MGAGITSEEWTRFHLRHHRLERLAGIDAKTRQCADELFQGEVPFRAASPTPSAVKV
jgi:hypothetical protein